MADIESLAIYLSVLIVTLLLAALYKKVYFRTNFGRIVFLIIIALPFSILAGVRYGVGVDYFNYINFYKQLQNVSILEAISSLRLEPLFIILFKVSYHFFESYSVMFFLLEFITFFVALVAFDRLRPNLSLTFSIFLYYLFAYHLSLNIMRQVLAMSFVLLSLTYIIEKKYLKALLWIVVAYLFHNSAIVGVAFVLIPIVSNRFFEREREDSTATRNLFRLSTNGLVIRTLFYLVIFSVPVFIGTIIDFFTKIGVINSYYAHYIGEGSTGLGTLFQAVIMLAPMIILGGSEIKQDNRLSILRDCSLLYIPISFVGYYASWAVRLSLYPEMVLIILIPMLMKKIDSTINRRVLFLYYLGLILFYYIRTFLILNQNATFPFVFVS